MGNIGNRECFLPNWPLRGLLGVGRSYPHPLVSHFDPDYHECSLSSFTEGVGEHFKRLPRVSSAPIGVKKGLCPGKSLISGGVLSWGAEGVSRKLSDYPYAIMAAKWTHKPSLLL